MEGDEYKMFQKSSLFSVTAQVWPVLGEMGTTMVSDFIATLCRDFSAVWKGGFARKFYLSRAGDAIIFFCFYKNRNTCLATAQVNPRT